MTMTESDAGTENDAGGSEGGAAGPSVWRIGPEDAPVVVRNAEALLAHLPFFAGGWPVRWAGPQPPPQIDIDITQGPGDTYAIVGYGPGGTEMHLDNAFDAANALAGALVSELVAADPGLICLHAGTAEMGAGLVLLLGASGAGKSTLALQLAASGHRLFGDDRLAVRLAAGNEIGPEGMCLGLMPKIRLPIPEDNGAQFRQFVDGCTELSGGGVAYLKPWPQDSAEFGERARLAALVVLDRRDGAPGTLAPASRSEIVQALVANSFAPHMPAQRLVEELSRLAGAVPGYGLRFGTSRGAAERLVAELAAPAAR